METNELTTNLKRITDYIKSGKCKKVTILSGAGISVNAGIPDFRSKNGLFNTIDVNNPDLHLSENEKQLILQQPEYIANIELFRSNPFPIYNSLSSFYTNKYKPTISHYFISLLYKHNLLKRIYTQNIDGLHYKSGIPKELICNVHGTISSAKCIQCGYILNDIQFNEFKNKLQNKQYPIYCQNIRCSGMGSALIKPNVILYGENLPVNYFKLVSKEKELKDVDLLIIIGTSLMVYPVAGIVNQVPFKNNCIRMIINKDKLTSLKYDYDDGNDKNDVHCLGDSDKICLELIKLLKWEKELIEIQSKANSPLSSKL